ncbi:MAG TPA: methyltransferase domain-containing protein [Candidatus Saccharimonadales bacterium]|nr:methyltransferase domain-containing protein [Candidatus Saccharimonadales bacterium]
MPERASATYTHGHHESVLRSHRWRTAENSAAYLLPHLQPGMSLLDVGCGPGTITIDLGRRLAPGRVVGLDAVAGPLDAARADAATAGLDNATFRVGDAYALPFDDDSFDVVHAHQVLQHLADPVAALREMARVARPGGLIAARDSDYGAMTWHPPDPQLDGWLRLYRDLARSNGGEPDAGRILLAWAHAAGLRDVTPGASTWCFATPADRAWWGGLWAERVIRSAFADGATTAGLASRDDLERIADAFRRWAASDDGWFVVTSGEILCRT